MIRTRRHRRSDVHGSIWSRRPARCLREPAPVARSVSGGRHPRCPGLSVNLPGGRDLTGEAAPVDRVKFQDLQSMASGYGDRVVAAPAAQVERGGQADDRRPTTSRPRRGEVGVAAPRRLSR
ncbi:hypothetical protein FMEAI12_3650012 [Parafrankia sp. Ea1.12]|nr:hypothetical protein FMEAI12_3650012 [Parafrankia sp. Ea1.12]